MIPLQIGLILVSNSVVNSLEGMVISEKRLQFQFVSHTKLSYGFKRLIIEHSGHFYDTFRVLFCHFGAFWTAPVLYFYYYPFNFCVLRKKVSHTCFKQHEGK